MARTCRPLEGLCTLSEPFPRLDGVICGILPRRLGDAAGVSVGSAITPQTRQYAAAGFLLSGLGRKYHRSEMGCLDEFLSWNFDCPEFIETPLFPA